MSDLDKWYMWHEAVTDTSKPIDEIANMVCVMTGRDIVRYSREKNYIWDYHSVPDQVVLNNHITLYWAVPCEDPSTLRVDDE
jgi:hypothetical protein